MVFSQEVEEMMLIVRLIRRPHGFLLGENLFNQRMKNGKPSSWGGIGLVLVNVKNRVKYIEH